MPIENIPTDANIVGSHVVYKIKVKSELNNGQPKKRFKLKSRLRLHRYKDKEHESLRTDAAVVPHIGFRLTYFVAYEQGMILAKSNVRGAYTQSGEAQRKIFEKSTFRSMTDKVMKLLKTTSYGIVPAGHKWQRKSDGIVEKKLVMEIVVAIVDMQIIITSCLVNNYLVRN